MPSDQVTKAQISVAANKYAYKLMRERKDGTLGSLFINRSERYKVGGFMIAKSYPTKGFALRPFIHCTAEPEAPHLSAEGRRWVAVRIVGPYARMEYRGKTWLLANQVQIMEKL